MDDGRAAEEILEVLIPVAGGVGHRPTQPTRRKVIAQRGDPARGDREAGGVEFVLPREQAGDVEAVAQQLPRA